LPQRDVQSGAIDRDSSPSGRTADYGNGYVEIVTELSRLPRAATACAVNVRRMPSLHVG
jgi:hypothetical protein